MDARALDAPQKDARRAVRSTCAPALAAGLFRRRADPQPARRGRKRHREQRTGNFNCGCSGAGRSTSSPGAVQFCGTAVCGTACSPAARPDEYRIHRPWSPSSRRQRTRWSRARTGRCSSFCSRRRERFHPGGFRRDCGGRFFGYTRAGRATSSASCCGGSEGSSGSGGRAAASSKGCGRACHRSARLW